MCGQGPGDSQGQKQFHNCNKTLFAFNNNSVVNVQ